MKHQLELGLMNNEISTGARLMNKAIFSGARINV